MGTIEIGVQKSKQTDFSLFEKGNIPLVDCECVSSSKRLYITRFNKRYNNSGVKQSKLFPKNTLCIVKDGNGVGDSALLGLKKACLSQHVYGFNSFQELVDQKFIKYCFEYPEIKRIIFSLSSSDTAQPGLHLYKLLTIKFPNPSYEIQKKIGDTLSAYDELVEALEEKIQLLEEIRDSFYKEWFIKLRFPNFKNHSFIDGLPKNWKVMNLKDIAEITRGTKPSSHSLNIVGGGTKRLIHFLLVLLKLRDLLLTPMTLFHY